MFYADASSTQVVTYKELFSFLNKECSSFDFDFSTPLNSFKSFLFAVTHNLDIVLNEPCSIGPIEKLDRPIDSISSLMMRLTRSVSGITFSTSGTTGKPKTIIQHISALTRNLKVSEKYSADIWGLTYQPNSIAGIQVLLQALANGNTIVNLHGLKPNLVAQQINDLRVNRISGTPSFYRMLISTALCMPHVRSVSFGGERCDSDLLCKIKLAFPNSEFRNIYALTESGTLLTSKSDQFTIGAELSEFIKVSDRNELLVHRNLIGKSNHLETQMDFYQTGDEVEWIDKAKGTFRFKCRINELINTGGYKVNPLEVEASLRAMKEVEDAHVFGQPNSVLGNVLCAKIVLAKGVDVSERSLKNYLRSNLLEYKVPRRFIFVNQIEINQSGKLSRVNV